MKIICGMSKIKRLPRKTVIAIGVFDGVHRGHRVIIKRAVSLAHRAGLKALILTFDPHPYHALHPHLRPPRIMSLDHRLKFFKELGVDICVVIRFDRRFSRLTAEGFAKYVLSEKLNAKKVIVGENFAFGSGKKGTKMALKKYGKRYNFSVECIKPVKARKRIISSSYIRRLITEGKLKNAARLLGRPVSVLGTVTRGDSRGRIIGFPTANINPHHEVIPPSGVYSVNIRLQYKAFNGILNIGKCPTFKSNIDTEPTIEVHIFDFERDIYGCDLEILFVKKIRDEKCFSTREALVGQIRKDERRVRSEVR